LPRNLARMPRSGRVTVKQFLAAHGRKDS